MIGEKVEKVRWDLGRAKRARSRLRAAVWAAVGGRERVLTRFWWDWGTGTRGSCGFLLRAGFGFVHTRGEFCVWSVSAVA